MSGNQVYGKIDGIVFYDAHSYYAYILSKSKDDISWDDEEDLKDLSSEEKAKKVTKKAKDVNNAILKQKRRRTIVRVAAAAAGIAALSLGGILVPAGAAVAVTYAAGGLVLGGSAVDVATHWKDIVGRTPEVAQARFTKKQDKLDKQIERINKLKANYKQYANDQEKQKNENVYKQYDKDLEKLIEKELESVTKFERKTVMEKARQIGHLHPQARSGIKGALDRIRQGGNGLAVNLFGYEGFEQRGIKRIEALDANHLVAVERAAQIIEFARENGITLSKKYEKDAERILEEAKKIRQAEQESEQTDENKKEDEKTLETGLSKYLFSDERDLAVYDFVLKNDIPIEALKNEDKFKEFLTQSVGLEQEHVDEWFAEYMLVVEVAFSQKYEKDSPEFKTFDEALKEWRNPEQKFGYSQTYTSFDGAFKFVDENTNDALSFINFNNIEITQEQIDKIESEEVKEQVQLYYDLTVEKEEPQFMYSIPSSNKDYEYVDSRSLKAAQYLLELQEKCKNENLDFDQEYKKSPVIIRKVIQDRFVNDPKFSGLVETLGMGKELYPVPTQKDLTGFGRLSIEYQDKLVDLWKTNESVKVEKNKQKEISNILTSLDSMININDLEEEYVNDVNKFSKEAIDYVGTRLDERKELFENKAFINALESYNKEHEDDPYYLWNMTKEQIVEIQKLVDEKAKEESEEKNPNEVNEEDTKKAVEDLEPQYYEVDDSWKEWIDAYNQEQLEKPENERFIIDPMKFDEKAYSKILSYVKNSQKEATATNEDKQTKTTPVPEEQPKEPKQEPKPEEKKEENTQKNGNGVLNLEDEALKAMVNKYNKVRAEFNDIYGDNIAKIKKENMTKEQFRDIAKTAYNMGIKTNNMRLFDEKIKESKWIENYNLNHKDAPLSLENITEEQFIELAFYSVYGPEKTKKNEKKATGLMDKNEPRILNGKIEIPTNKTSEPSNKQTNAPETQTEEAEQKESVIETKDYSDDKVIRRVLKEYKNHNETELKINSLTQEDYEMLLDYAFVNGMNENKNQIKDLKRIVSQNWLKEYNKDKPKKEQLDVKTMSLDDFKKLADKITNQEPIQKTSMTEQQENTTEQEFLSLANALNEYQEAFNKAKEEKAKDESSAERVKTEIEKPEQENDEKVGEKETDGVLDLFGNVKRGSDGFVDTAVGVVEDGKLHNVTYTNQNTTEDKFEDGTPVPAKVGDGSNTDGVTLDKLEPKQKSPEQIAFEEQQMQNGAIVTPILENKTQVEEIARIRPGTNAAKASTGGSNSNSNSDKAMLNS